jgi:transcriptional regulator with XRE-family HTH domain
MNAESGSILAAFGARVRASRNRLGLSQEGLASRSGLHRTYIGGIERGERNIALINIVQLAKSLEIDPGDLVRGMGYND